MGHVSVRSGRSHLLERRVKNGRERKLKKECNSFPRGVRLGHLRCCDILEWSCSSLEVYEVMALGVQMSLPLLLS